ncbi:MAG: hypothetical protein MJ120_04080 [Clostridia bacterium]|nr:hypothetical protein [Clostridia bacterium]
MASERDELIFSGYFERNLDEKGRLAIPARLRSQLEKAQSKDEVVYVHYSLAYNSIRIYPYDGWIEFVQPKIDAIEDHDKRVLMMRTLYHFTEEQRMDAQGRILVNKKLAAKLGIEKGVSIIGEGRGIEITALKEDDNMDLDDEQFEFLKSIIH